MDDFHPFFRGEQQTNDMSPRSSGGNVQGANLAHWSKSLAVPPVGQVKEYCVKSGGNQIQTNKYYIMYQKIMRLKWCITRGTVFSKWWIFIIHGFSNHGSHILQDLKLISLQGPKNQQPRLSKLNQPTINFQGCPPSLSGNLQPRKHRHLYLVRAACRSGWLAVFEATNDMLSTEKKRHIII